MKNVSNKMYNIGRIFSIIEFIVGCCLVTLGTLLFFLELFVEDFSWGGGLKTLISGSWMVIGAVLCFVFVNKAKKELTYERSRNKKPFIMTIVFGAVAGNIFYVLAGIFGLIADGQQGEQPKEEPKQVEEKPAEEPAEEPKDE